eukprot:CAMPEP_0194326564 /NCGR_PEP_ID=MMETSP0171-20130528/36971_1 /TAXON_ID=218684 /ORGANISM="Corethron pennatum, Strain L29A3" /LENGTH=73 /DNA_ID=CAMNT_0039086185 /DNA_START=69 /DNA_END=286 /DNA_ORIENTATION=-
MSILLETNLPVLPRRGASATADSRTGDLVLDLDISRAPAATASLLSLARSGLYDGTLLHALRRHDAGCAGADG